MEELYLISSSLSMQLLFQAQGQALSNSRRPVAVLHVQISLPGFVGVQKNPKKVSPKLT